jgi:L-rhamnose mutarotase
MRVVKETIYFEGTEALFQKEKSGRKNNTVRVLSEQEHNAILWKAIKDIEITNPATNESFAREITDVSRIGTMCGRSIVVFSWRV